MKNTRERAIQWCLDQGHGIEYSAENGAVTTQAELDAAKRTGESPRYVDKETAAFWIDGIKNNRRIQETIEKDLGLLDYDEWDSTCRALGVDLSWNDSSAINEIFYEKYDYTPLNAPDYDEENTSIAKAFGFEPEDSNSVDRLKGHDAQAIYDILQKYPEAAEKFDAPDEDVVEWDAREELITEIYNTISKEEEQQIENMKKEFQQNPNKTIKRINSSDFACEIAIKNELVAWAQEYMHEPDGVQLTTKELKNFISSKEVFPEGLIQQVSKTYCEMGGFEEYPANYDVLEDVISKIASKTARIEKRMKKENIEKENLE